MALLACLRLSAPHNSGRSPGGGNGQNSASLTWLWEISPSLISAGRRVDPHVEGLLRYSATLLAIPGMRVLHTEAL